MIDRVAPEDSAEFALMWSKLCKIAPLVEKSVFAHPYDKPWQLADPSLIKFALPFDVRKTYKELVDGMFKSPLLRAFFLWLPFLRRPELSEQGAGGFVDSLLHAPRRSLVSERRSGGDSGGICPIGGGTWRRDSHRCPRCRV